MHYVKKGRRENSRARSWQLYVTIIVIAYSLSHSSGVTIHLVSFLSNHLLCLGIVLPSEINLFLQMQSQCYVNASYLALVCMFGKCGMIEYFYHSRSFASISAHQENFINPLWLFTIYTIRMEVFSCNLCLGCAL